MDVWKLQALRGRGWLRSHDHGVPIVTAHEFEALEFKEHADAIAELARLSDDPKAVGWRIVHRPATPGGTRMHGAP